MSDNTQNMAQYIEKANILVEALPYIWVKQFRKKTVVIKYGGSFMYDNDIKNPSWTTSPS